MKVLLNNNQFDTIAPNECQEIVDIDARNIVRVLDNDKTGGRILLMRNGERISVLSMPLIYR